MGSGQTVIETNGHNSDLCAEMSRVDHTTYFNNRIHFHSFFELEYFLSGEGTYEINNTKLPIKKGMLFLTSPADYHTYRIPENKAVEYFCIQFFPKYITPDLSAYFYSTAEPVSLALEDSEAQFFCDFCQRCVDVYNGKGYMYMTQLGNLTENLCIEIVRRKRENPATVTTYSAVKKAIIYVRENFAKEITLKDIANLTNLSEAYFSHVFSQATGIGFSSYVKKIRLNTAADLVKSTDLSCKEICYLCGFKNTNYFTDSFRSEFGISPGAYRKQRKK